MSFATDLEISEGPGSLTPRGVFVPPWYKPHKKTDLQVRDRRGHPMGFTIADVCVERRWAIDPEGKVMGQDFAEKLSEWYIGQWTWRNPPQPPLPVDTSAYPTPEAYVSKGPDPANPRRVLSLTPQVVREKLGKVERPVDVAVMAKSPAWAPAPKKDE